MRSREIRRLFRGAVVLQACRNAQRCAIVLIHSRLHLLPCGNAIILAAKADAGPVGVGYRVPP
jgi:hypothetical protein